jgi:hypothetical protein
VAQSPTYNEHWGLYPSLGALNAATLGNPSLSAGDTAVVIATDYQYNGTSWVIVTAEVANAPVLGAAVNTQTSNGSAMLSSETSTGDASVRLAHTGSGFAAELSATTLRPRLSSSQSGSPAALELDIAELVIGGTAGAAGEMLTSNGPGLAPTWQAGGGGGSPAGADTEIQFNNAGAFGASSNLTWNGDTLSITGSLSPLTVTSPFDGQFLEVNAALYSLTLTDPLNPTSAGVFGPGDLAIGNGTQSGNVYAGQVSATDNGTTHTASLSVPSGVATLSAVDSGSTPVALDVVVGELRVNGDVGTSGYVLTSNGAGLAPTWQAGGGGGGGITASVTTNDDTPTALVTLAVGASSTTVYEATVAARKQGSTDAASYRLAGTFVEDSGTVTQLGTTNVVWSHESDPGLNADFVISGPTVELQVTGQAPVGPAFIDPVAPPTPSGTTWTVGTLGGEDFPDLATALASGSVVNGDRLLLSAETFTTGAITVSKQVTIQGAGLASTVLQTTADGAAPVVFITVSTSNVTLRDLTIKHRRTTNTSIESAISITAGAGSSGHYLQGVRVEGMEFCVIIKSDGWQINNCQLAYVGPNNSTRRLIGIYRSDGQGLFCNSTYDSGQNGVITGSTRVVAITTGASPPDEVLGGYLRIGNVTPSNGFPVHQFFNCDYFGIGATPLTLVVDNCTAAETSLFVGFVLPSTQPPLTRCAGITLQGNTLTNSHGKGALAIAGVSGGPVSPGTTTYYAGGNTLGATAFTAGWATGIDPSGVPATDALLGVQTANWSDPNQAVSTPTPAVWDWTATITPQVAP